jgi:[NiFe] hydrogenase assembly HybE family chaperone
MSDAAVLRPDPAAALEATYRHVQATRMSGLPFLNPALAVEAVGFAPWRAHWLGVIVTPWFMNLVVAPRDASQWKSLPPGEKRRYSFPAGDYDFISAREEGVGEFFICSLFSPVLEFDDQPTARYVAAQALAALLDSANDERAAERAAERAEPPGPLAQVEKAMDAPLSRRELLRGRILPGTDGPRR